MFDFPGIKLTGEFGNADPVIAAVITVTSFSDQPVWGQTELLLRGFQGAPEGRAVMPLERAGRVRQNKAGLPVWFELMLKTDTVVQGTEPDIPVVGFAEETVNGDHVQLTVNSDDSPVKRTLLPSQLAT